ncbi:TIGR03084 family metal-binding protein [Catenulispora yoronensis]|uniref:TIGR03084 family metal-binding protein n=2 Tax=Catenulispora yoronensis TaxID=450799 RepID=A0ABN2UUU3_9ACTN
MQDVYTDLAAEADELDALVSGLDEEEWNRATPSPGWTVGHQIAHLAFIAHLAWAAAADQEQFQRLAAQAKADFQGSVDAALEEYTAGGRAETLARWRAEQAAATKALAAVPADQVVPWLVNPLPPSILAAAGLMELFGHGQDVYDALGVERVPSDRIGHLAFFGARTRDFGYLAHGITPPEGEFRFELAAPSGAVWKFGPEDAADRVVGPALDFCLLVTRRRHHADLALAAEGDEAKRWLEIAQAFRGPAGEGRRAGQFR